MSLTIHRLLEKGIRRLNLAGKYEASLDARLLLEATLECDRIFLILNKEKVLTEAEVDGYLWAIEERAKGRPLQHILKQQEFMGLKFKVTSATLIPRRETEELVEIALNLVKGAKPYLVMDLGTGSGCIPISLAVFRKNVFAIGVDLSPNALEVAIENGMTHGVQERMTWVLSDLYENIDQKYLAGVDLLISNPPYIKTEDISELMPEVKDFEPNMALDGGRDGLEFYRRICKDAKGYLKDGGNILFEIGYNQSIEVCELLKDHGFKEIRCIKDLSGMDRMVCAKK